MGGRSGEMGEVDTACAVGEGGTMRVDMTTTTRGGLEVIESHFAAQWPWVNGRESQARALAL